MEKTKLSLSILALLLVTGCSSIKTLTFRDTDSFPAVGDLKFTSSQSLTQEQVFFDEATALKQLSEIKSNISLRRERLYPLESRDSTYEIYVGEYIKLPAMGTTRFSVLGTDENQYESRTSDGFFYFRTIYQGTYDIRVDFQNGISKIIRVVNKTKYRFTESETYAIIKNSYSLGRYREFQELTDLFKMAFPKSSRNVEFGFMALNLYINNGNYSFAKDKLGEIKKEKNLSDRDVLEMFNAEVALNPKYKVEQFYTERSKFNFLLATAIRNYTGNTPEFKPELKPEAESQVITTNENEVSPVLDSKSIWDNFNFFSKEPKIEKTDETVHIENKEKLPSLDSLETVSKAPTISNEGNRQYDSGKQAYDRGRYSEAILMLNRAKQSNAGKNDIDFYLGESYFKTSNFEKAVESYNSYLRTTGDGIRKAEAYYNSGISLEKLGKKEQALSSFQRIIEQFPGTSWARKANIYIVRLKSQ